MTPDEENIRCEAIVVTRILTDTLDEYSPSLSATTSALITMLGRIILLSADDPVSAVKIVADGLIMFVSNGGEQVILRERETH